MHEEQNKIEWLLVHDQAMVYARNLKNSYGQIMAALIEVDEHRVYFRVDLPDLYTYCVKMLELPESTARDFVSVIRTSKEVPELAEAVISGRTTVSKARRVCSVITPTHRREWIDLVSECSLAIVKKCVAMANPRAALEESLKYVSGDSLELTFAVSEEWAELLKNTKDLMSQKERRSVSTEDALFKLMADYYRKNDPVAKAERAASRASECSFKMPSALILAHSPAAKSTSDLQVANVDQDIHSGRPKNGDVVDRYSERTRYRPMTVEYAVDLRDRNQCVHVDAQGIRCANKRWLHKHHIVEFADGGAHTLENLETLCSGHHRMKHFNSGHADKESAAGR